MTVASTIDAIQTAMLAVSGITAAPAHSAYPGNLNTADMPISITWPDSGTARLKGSGYDISKMVYKVAIYVLPAEQGGGIYEGWNDTIDLMQLVLDALMDKDINNLVEDGTYQSYITASQNTPLIHGGLQMLAYPPPATGVEGWPHYFGFEILVPTNEQWSQT